MAHIKTSRGLIEFRQHIIYDGMKRQDDLVALENLRILTHHLDRIGLNREPAFGILIGIVGDDSLVVHGFEPDSYVEVISRLVENRDLWELKSRQVHERVKHNFTQTIVEGNLKKELEDLIKS